ncbi:hypothetical protein Aab01nite_46560 [Paractinoplanes abujensis]|uniref:Uncharacterized protein n=1 Tax=Paractinoplanes abujensis TaxID=882441 RepID=A0A7W7CNI5_9ACTN|nr:hypothetical protein [Actinoplanes abujensis]MBB4690303.1 hypothetical protein [Actinoplanes abujensis]GID21066.1 hypothetical protein Aab01nite_46560 [Actinoplanes abujensis]
MPGQRFKVQLTPDDMPSLPGLAGDSAEANRKPAAGAKHHGATDERQAARQRSERAHAGRAAGAGGGRSYAFRRS